MAQFGKRVHVTAEDANNETDSRYELVFVRDTSATTCYGRKGRVRVNSHLHSHLHCLIYSFVTVNSGFLIALGRPRLESAQDPRWFIIIR